MQQGSSTHFPKLTDCQQKALTFDSQNENTQKLPIQYSNFWISTDYTDYTEKKGYRL